MKQKTNKMLIFTSLAAYFTYFIHGIGASILGQYKPEFAAAWGAKPLADGTLDVSMVVSVIAALGLGRLISLPFSGPLSDKYGRKLSGIIGVLCYVAYFFGMANSTSMAMTDVANQASIRVLSMSLDDLETAGDGLRKMMEMSVTPGLGANIDVSV